MNSPICISMTSRFEECNIGYWNPLPGHWAHVDCNEPGRHAEVGPVYKTKAELLANHDQYLIDGGWIRKATEHVPLTALEHELLTALADLLARTDKMSEAGAGWWMEQHAARSIIAKAKGGAA